MEFWGVEVKPGETVKCGTGDDKYLHLSQASLGEVRKEKGNESIPIHLKFDEQKLVIGTLSADKCPQITYDLVFEKEFELSHSWKNGSVFFVGYRTEIPDDGPDDFMDESDSESEEDTPVPVKKEANGKPEPKFELAKAKAHAPKADSLAAKPSVKSEEIGKAKKAEEENDSDEDDNDSEEDESDDEDGLDGVGDSSDEDEGDNEDESSEEEDDATPKRAEIGKKRTAESASKTPAPDKKAKLVTSAGQKTGGADGERGGHMATPHPAKQAGKTPTMNDKSKQQAPKSVGSVACKSCSRTFKDDNALQAHTKAKHSGK